MTNAAIGYVNSFLPAALLWIGFGAWAMRSDKTNRMLLDADLRDKEDSGATGKTRTQWAILIALLVYEWYELTAFSLAPGAENKVVREAVKVIGYVTFQRISGTGYVVIFILVTLCYYAFFAAVAYGYWEPLTVYARTQQTRVREWREERAARRAEAKAARQAVDGAAAETGEAGSAAAGLRKAAVAASDSPAGGKTKNLGSPARRGAFGEDDGETGGTKQLEDLGSQRRTKTQLRAEFVRAKVVPALAAVLLELLFIPTSRLSMEILHCNHNVSPARLYWVPSMHCWEAGHAFLALLAWPQLVVGYGSTLFWMLRKNSQPDGLQDFVYLPRFEVLVAVGEFFLTLMFTWFFDEPWVVIFSLVITVTTFFVTNVYYQPCLGLGAITNHWRAASFGGAVFGAIIGLVAVATKPGVPNAVPIVFIVLLVPAMLAGYFVSRFWARRMERRLLERFFSLSLDVAAERKLLTGVVAEVALLALIDSKRRELLAAGVLPRLAELMHRAIADKDKELQTACTYALANVSADVEQAEEILRLKLVKPLVAGLEEESDDTRQRSAQALGNLAHASSEIRLKIHAAKGPAQLVALIGELNNDRVQMASLRALVALAEEEPVAEFLLESKATTTLTLSAMRRTRTERVMTLGGDLLERLCEKGTPAKLMNQKVLQTMCALREQRIQHNIVRMCTRIYAANKAYDEVIMRSALEPIVRVAVEPGYESTDDSLLATELLSTLDPVSMDFTPPLFIALLKARPFVSETTVFVCEALTQQIKKKLVTKTTVARSALDTIARIAQPSGLALIRARRRRKAKLAEAEAERAREAAALAEGQTTELLAAAAADATFADATGAPAESAVVNGPGAAYAPSVTSLPTPTMAPMSPTSEADDAASPSLASSLGGPVQQDEPVVVDSQPGSEPGTAPASRGASAAPSAANSEADEDEELLRDLESRDTFNEAFEAATVLLGHLKLTLMAADDLAAIYRRDVEAPAEYASQWFQQLAVEAAVTKRDTGVDDAAEALIVAEKLASSAGDKRIRRRARRWIVNGDMSGLSVEALIALAKGQHSQVITLAGLRGLVKKMGKSNVVRMEAHENGAFEMIKDLIAGDDIEVRKHACRCLTNFVLNDQLLVYVLNEGAILDVIRPLLISHRRVSARAETQTFETVSRLVGNLCGSTAARATILEDTELMDELYALLNHHNLEVRKNVVRTFGNLCISVANRLVVGPRATEGVAQLVRESEGHETGPKREAFEAGLKALQKIQPDHPLIKEHEASLSKMGRHGTVHSVGALGLATLGARKFGDAARARSSSQSLRVRSESQSSLGVRGRSDSASTLHRARSESGASRPPVPRSTSSTLGGHVSTSQPNLNAVTASLERLKDGAAPDSVRSAPSSTARTVTVPLAPISKGKGKSRPPSAKDKAKAKDAPAKGKAKDTPAKGKAKETPAKGKAKDAPAKGKAKDAPAKGKGKRRRGSSQDRNKP